ncbi:hypothetical protein V5N34_28535, partial [Streptomyces baarnensis]|uniref:hypothetical protein n=1 Tax=Streptomyces baarnensis TaxID=66872 RepID=UPI003AF79A92
MQWPWTSARTWFRGRRRAGAAASAPVPPSEDGVPWQRLPVLRPTVRSTPWTVAALGRASVARAGTRSLVHRTQAAPWRSGRAASSRPEGAGPSGASELPTAPVGRADDLAVSVPGRPVSAGVAQGGEVRILPRGESVLLD